MSTLTIIIVAVFITGYACIAMENVIKVNKAAVSLLMFAACWTIFMFNPGEYISIASPDSIASDVSTVIEHHLGTTATTLFFLMGAMTIVEVVDQNGGFHFVRDALCTKSKRTLLWRIAFMTFFLSAVLDNLTTSIVMIMVLRKLVKNASDRIIYASIVIIAANSGGAFSPIGDVTTIMLWNVSLITAGNVIKELFLPSVMSLVIPVLMMQFALKGNMEMEEIKPLMPSAEEFTAKQRKAIFAIGVGGLIFVPIFKSITHLPPFIGILLVLAVLWTVTEVFYTGLSKKKDVDGMKKRVSNILTRIDKIGRAHV